MKIFELAKQIGVSAGEITKAAKKMGMEKAGNFTSLSDTQARDLVAIVTGKASSKAEAPKEPAPAPKPKVIEPEAPVAPPRVVGTPLKAVTAKENRDRLADARSRALASHKSHRGGLRPFTPLAPMAPKPAPKKVAEPVPAPAPAPVAEAAAPAPIQEEKKSAPQPKVEVEPKVEVKAAEPAPKPQAEVKPAPVQEEKKPEAKPAKAVEKPAPEAKEEKPISIDFGGFGQMSGAPQGDSPRVVFHPAVQDDDDDDDDDRRGSRYEDDYYDDDDRQRDYFGGRRSQQQQTRKHHRDGREENDRDSRSRSSHGQHGASNQRNQQPQQRSGANANGKQPQQQQGGRFGNQHQNQNGRQGAQQQGGRPINQGQSPFPTRPNAQSVFPTRPGAQSVFPTRPGAQSPFPTRPNVQSVFPTRPGANARPLPQQQQARGPQPQGKNQRGQQPMNKNQNGQQQKAKAPVAVPPPPAANAPIAGDNVLTLRGPTLIRELAEMMNIRPNRLIADLMQQKVLVSINQRVDLEMAGKIADKYGFRVELERARRSTERKPEIRKLDEDDEIPEDKPEDMKPRPPVVTFLGHVDHGKTSLLDYLRKTKVAAGEAGGITQHIGAYSVEVNDRQITFLDTPGHAAFSAMRARGARLTDIAVIVVAADDGIMPQTREVIKQCRQANVQMMVAINKCDLPAAKPDRVRQQLQIEGLTPEDWGGDIVCCEVSAHTGAGMDNLLEMILLQADVLELQANPNRRADGYIIEAQMERGIGPTATLLVASGTLNVGDVVLIDEHYGRLRALIDDRGKQIKSVGPAHAVRVMGLSGVPEAGAEFRVMVNEKRARELAEKFAMERKATELQAAQKAVNIDSLLDRLGEREKKQLSVIIKADTQGTVEAIIDTLRDLRSEKISLEILGSSVGNVTAADVQRAAAGHAMIVGFQVNIESGVNAIATHDGVRINTFRIIYELFDFVKQSMLDRLDPEYKEVVKGHAQIRQIFDIGKLGKVAGSQLLDGVVRKDALVRIKRLREVLFEGKISSLKHFKDEVAEVRDMQEFGVSFVDFEDFVEGDVIECYAMEELERTL